NVKSYMSFPQLPKFRFPGFAKPKHNDIVVFNWPADTVYKFFDENKRHIDKPLDKRSNYVKRLVGMPGDDLSIKDGVVYINGKPLDLGDRAKIQYAYKVETDGVTQLDGYQLFNVMKIDPKSVGGTESPQTLIFYALTEENANLIKQMPGIKSVTKMNLLGGEQKDGKLSIFPHNQNWTGDNLGPIHIPAKGETVELNTQTLPLYERLISIYENNKLEVKNGQIYINGQLTNKYT